MSAGAHLILPRQLVSRYGERALRGAGVPPEVAAMVMAELLAAESEGAASHGLLRLPEYVAAIDRGEIVPNATPLVTRRGPHAMGVDARQAVGVLAAAVVRDTLLAEAGGGVAVVALTRAGHLGRLSSIARPLAMRGLVTLGFVNYSGTGQKVAPAGSAVGRLATNPIVFGCPAPGDRPVVVDLSTSAWPEGAVRAAAREGRAVPAGVLVDSSGAAVHDPGRLYSDPVTAALAPLGGIASHKGFALSVVVELMAGALGGGGVCSDVRTDGCGGNAGLFIAFRPQALGVDEASLLEQVGALEGFLSAGSTDPSTPVRLPGRGTSRPPAGAELTMPTWLWAEVRQLAGEGRG